MAGVSWTSGANPFELTNFYLGVEYACLILGFLTAHEFGHYFAAKYHRVPCTLPYYIPLPLVPGIIPISFGTMGAVIKIKGLIPSRKALFDIGAAGPIAGFVVCYAFLVIGFLTLPDISYLHSFHPEFVMGKEVSPGNPIFGDTLIFGLTQELFARPGGFIPPMHEIYHYPLLNVGWFGLFVTALNMLPLGQLDGGHVTYAMFGKRQWKIAKWFWRFLVVIGLSALLDLAHEILEMLYYDDELGSFSRRIYYILRNMKETLPWLFMGWGGWLFWALLARFFTGIQHPPIGGGSIGKARMAVGWLLLLIFVLCFSWNGIYFS